MDKPTVEDTSEEIKRVDTEKSHPTQRVKPKSEYSRAERKTIHIGLIILALIFAGAVYFLLERTNNQPLESATETETYTNAEDTSQLDQVELQEISEEDITGTSEHIVFYSDAIGHFVPVPVIEEASYFATIEKRNANERLDHDRFATELKERLLDDAYEPYQPDQTEISARDESRGIRRYVNASVYCIIQLSEVDSRANMNASQGVGFVKKICADEQNVRRVVADLQRFYELAVEDEESSGTADNDSTLLLLDSGTYLSPIEGYEYKLGTETQLGSTTAVDIAFVRFEQDDWSVFRYSLGETVCDEYTSQAVRNALASQNCIDPESNESVTVGEYYNLL